MSRGVSLASTRQDNESGAVLAHPIGFPQRGPEPPRGQGWNRYAEPDTATDKKAYIAQTGNGQMTRRVQIHWADHSEEAYMDTPNYGSSVAQRLKDAVDKIQRKGCTGAGVGSGGS
ncbi:hypothetical protein BaRGS_00030668 [Batillaria attramentaria]|uniref:Uncharacterized protein n=1 Tax=Batillaria attramentaria TaxID=370345 RepID=A0ABD0JSM1_9CAEN